MTINVVPTKLAGDESPEEYLRAVFAPNDSNPASDTRANEEAVAFATERDIEKEGKEHEHDRHQAFRDHINYATIFIFWVIAACIIIGIVTFAFHMVTPESFHWLNQAQLDKLQTMLGAAVLSSALTGYVKKRMD